MAKGDSRSGFDFKAQRKSVRDLRVTQHAQAAVDHLWEVAKEGTTKTRFLGALVFWFDKIAEEYEGEIASLKTALNVQRATSRRISDRGGE